MSDAVPTSGTSPDVAAEAALKAEMKARQKAVAKARRADHKAGRRAVRATKRQQTREQKAATPREPAHIRQQLASILKASHPRQAVLMALVVGVLAKMTDRPLVEALLAGAAVLVVQLILGLGNDIADEQIDRKAGTAGKPLAEGAVPRGNVTYAVLVLLLVAVPLSLQNGYLAGGILLGTLLVGGVHNKWLHRGLFSWVGWTVTFALLPAFLAYGSFAGDPHGPAPTWAFTLAASFLGLCLHFATSLPDLVQDHAAGLKSLPLRVALKTGAPRLLQITAVATGLALVALLVAGLTVGIRQ